LERIYDYFKRIWDYYAIELAGGFFGALFTIFVLMIYFVTSDSPRPEMYQQGYDPGHYMFAGNKGYTSRPGE
jgi:hypothetical protein